MRFLAATATWAVSHHTYNKEDPCRHFCSTSRCSDRSAGHHCRLPLVAPSCLPAVESCRGQVLSARCCCACPHCPRISRTGFLKTFQSVSRALFKKQHILFQCTFRGALQYNAHVHVGRHDLAKAFLLHLRTSRLESANLGNHPRSSNPASDSQLHPGRVQFHGSPRSHHAFLALSAAARLLLPAMFHRCRVQQCTRCLGNGL